MCGIVGYTGFKSAAPILTDGLRKLEYRGYDSYGIVIPERTGFFIHKACGRISGYIPSPEVSSGTCGIGHTRWATHGDPSDENAHPHTDCTNSIAIVHNGIIENYSELKRGLEKRGHVFRSETDSEIIAHMLEEAYNGSLFSAMKQVIPYLTGSFAILAVHAGDGEIVAARFKSPLALGIGDGELFAGSDITPMIGFTNRFIFLDDGDIAVITPETYVIYADGIKVSRDIQQLDLSPDQVRKGGFPHFMLKEIYEGPDVFADAIRSLTSETLPEPIKDAGSFTVVGCGSSYHAGLIFKYLMEEAVAVPVRVEIGSEFKYARTPLSEVIIGISQSGETADTLAALEKGRCHNHSTVAITNVLNSSITRMAENTCFMHAGPEISVAATKSFIAQTGILMQIINIRSNERYDEVLGRISHLMQIVSLEPLTEAVNLCKDSLHIFFVGRGVMYPVMMEGALKMKEISYIHAEAYAAGELKHGPFALLGPETPVIAVCLPGRTYHVMISNIKEMKARKTPVIAIGEENDTELSDIVDIMIPVPGAHLWQHVLQVTVLLQLFAYHTAAALGRDIDKPRNLAKSVTVE
ncbi:MAG: glutamine--fructose-6-phosphate transaminase (isomerizing) [Methanospirillaceae archaeon]|nr:glutamine--fructose-6-phosphate transaminase (isomerizing) [Methanospirillaceae archaeon]